MHAFFPQLAALEERPYWRVQRPWQPANMRQRKTDIDSVVDLSRASSSMLFCHADQMLFTVPSSMDVQARVRYFRSGRDRRLIRLQQNHSHNSKSPQPSSGVDLGAPWLAKSCAACLHRNTLKHLRRMSPEKQQMSAYIVQALAYWHRLARRCCLRMICK
jgi:hypothetical protein